MSIEAPLAPEQSYEVTDFTQWHSVVGSTFVPASMSCVHPGTFSGRIRRLHVGNLEIIDMAASAHVASRTVRDDGAVRSGEDFILSLQIAGTEELRQNRRSAMLEPGDFVLYDASNPFLAEVSPEFRGLNVRLSRAHLGISPSELSRLSAHRLHGTAGLAPLVGSMLRRANDTLAQAASTQPRATFDAAEHVLSLVRDFLVGCLEERGRVDPVARRAARDGDRVIALMLERLHDPELRAGDVARAAHISLRQLHRLFERRGETFGACLRRSRLERAAADLRNPDSSATTVAAIARRWGFSNPGHFSQLFSRRFGVTPLHFRRSERLAPHAVAPKSLA